MSATVEAPTVMHGYVRVSTAEQAGSGLGLSAQRQKIRQACRERSWTLHTTFEDAASGRSMDGRSGLQEAMESVARGEATGIVVAKLDRLSRSLLDFAKLMEQSRREGWALVALDLGVDTSTPQGELMATVLASFAQFERRLIGQRTKDALAELKAQGVQLGRPRLVPDDVADYARGLRADGLTLRAVADRLNAESVPTGTGSGEWFGSTVSRLLRSRETEP